MFITELQDGLSLESLYYTDPVQRSNHDSFNLKLHGCQYQFTLGSAERFTEN